MKTILTCGATLLSLQELSKMILKTGILRVNDHPHGECRRTEPAADGSSAGNQTGRAVRRQGRKEVYAWVELVQLRAHLFRWTDGEGPAARWTLFGSRRLLLTADMRPNQARCSWVSCRSVGLGGMVLITSSIWARSCSFESSSRQRPRTPSTRVANSRLRPTGLRHRSGAQKS